MESMQEWPEKTQLIFNRASRSRYARIAAAAMLILFLLPYAGAAELKTHYDIPAQSLAAALKSLAKAGNLQLVYSPDIVAGLRSQPLQGEYTPLEALDRLIAPAGLTYSFNGKDTIVVKRKPGVAAPASADHMSMTLVRPLETETQPSVVQTEEAAEDNEIVVTGTNIRGAAPAGSPVLVIGEMEIRRSGYTTTDQLLLALPQNVRSGVAGATADAELSNGAQAYLNNSRGSGVNLRGLGTVGTLTLINGRRVAASTSGTYTDISLIPLNAIERIEVLTDGASAIYGADAVAGVVNIILKRNYTGAETNARYGVTTDKGRDEVRLTQNLGLGWGSGNILAVVDYLDQSELDSSERKSTDNVDRPTTVFPPNKQLGFVLSGQQKLGERLSLQSDVQFMQGDRSGSVASFGDIAYRSIDVDRLNAAVSLIYSPFKDWDFTLDAVRSTEHVDFSFTLVDPEGQIDPDSSTIQNQKQEQWNAGLVANGTVFDLPGGRAGLALGVSHRKENYNRLKRSIADPTQSTEPADRGIDSVFAEMHLPFGHNVQMSIAGRYDDYTDFGSTVNPKVGLSWMPVGSLELRTSYSTSFRAPSTGSELSLSQDGASPAVIIDEFVSPDGIGTVPVAIAYGSTALKPEKSKNWTLGMTWRPAGLDGMQVGLTYYHIDYTDQIITPPYSPQALTDPGLSGFVTHYASPQALQAAIAEQVGPDAFYVDITNDFEGGAFGPNPENVTTYYYEQRYVNVGEVTTSGFDFTTSYGFELGNNQFKLGLNINRINEIKTVIAPGAPSFDLVDTSGNPANMRLRSTASWSRGGFDGALAVNYTDGYEDTYGLTPRGVSSYTTVDMNLRYQLQDAHRSLFDGLSLSLSLIDAFDAQPPYVNAAGLGANYDAANASPLGRMIGLQVGKRW